MDFTRAIAFLGAESTCNEEINTLSGLCQEAKNNGWNVFVFNALQNVTLDNELSYDSSIFQLANPKRFSAIFIGQNAMVNAHENCKKIITKCKDLGIPVISLGASVSECNSIVFSNTDCVEFVADHLIEHHNCKTFELIGGIKDNDFSNQRIESFKRSLAKHNLPFDEKRLHYGYFWEGGARQAVEDFYASGLPLPDAFVCCNDVMAMAVCGELQKRGLSVPGDVIVTGYDGYEVERYHSPRLTTVKCDCFEMGKTAFHYLMDIFDEKPVEYQMVLNPTLIFSESCGCKNISGRPGSNFAFEAIGMFGEQRHVQGMFHNFATRASEADCINTLKTFMPSSDHFGGDYWIFLNEDYRNILGKKKYTSENPFSENMEFFFSSGNPDIPDSTIIPVTDFLPDLQDSFNEESNALVFMNLFFSNESIGFFAVPFKGHENKILLMNAERLTLHLSQNLALVKNRQKLEFLNYNDVMTGIHNRRGFYHFFAIQIQNRCNTNGKMILHSIDMDGLKHINDTFGHKEGDFAITALAHALIKAGNESVIAARFGGDEFVAVEFIEENQTADETIFKNKLQEYLNKLNQTSGKPYSVSCSVGSHITEFNTEMNVDQIISIADELMYSEKSQKKRSSSRL